MSSRKTRVLIIDDSVFMRSMLKGALSDSADIEVVGTAQNGAEGLRIIGRLNPDVVTLDVEMPGISGLEVLERTMKERPLPVVMVSTKTQRGAQTTLEALRLGAVDYVAKPLAKGSATLGSFRDQVVRAVQTAAKSNRQVLGKQGEGVQSVTPVTDAASDVVVAIGISAGGPATLHRMIPAIPKAFPPVVITQHMPGDFTGPFAKRLNNEARIEIKEAAQNDVLEPGKGFLAPGEHHMRVVKRGPKLVVKLDDGPKVSGFRPSVDVLFDSVAVAVGSNAIGVIMTGMGCDGSVGVQRFRAQGAHTIAQDQATSIVYGMPKAAFETGCIDEVVALQDIPKAIARAIRKLAVSAR